VLELDTILVRSGWGPDGHVNSMSVDLAVWEGPQSASDDEACAVFDELCARYLGRSSVPPTERITEYVRLLLDRYPDPTETAGEEDEVPWGSGPMTRNASGQIVYIDMKLNRAFAEAWRYCVETAAANGLVAFDPQSGRLADPEPNAAPAGSPPS
jgi:hypothetical protein